METKTRTGQILTVMHILAWVAFIGFAIEGGAVLFSYGVSVVNAEAAKNLYQGLNFYTLRQFNFWYYTLSVSFLIAISIMKTYTWYFVTKTLSKINLKNPFTMQVASMLEKISYLLFGIWLVEMLNAAHISWLMKLTGEQFGNWGSGEFIFMAGLVFIISQIFKRGIEIQSENDLTV